MPKIVNKSTQKKLLKGYVNEFGQRELRVNGDTIVCGVCDSILGSIGKPPQRSQVKQHVNLASHKKNIQAPIQSTINLNIAPGQKQFNEDLANMLLKCDIPFHKINNTSFKEFIESHTSFKTPDESTLRKIYLPKISATKTHIVINELIDKPIWISIDESTDTKGRMIANVILGSLEENSKPHLFMCKELDATNNITISRLFNDAMHKLYGDQIKYENVLIFVSDGASYMKKAGEAISSMYSNCIHITCLSHGLHRVAEAIRIKFKNVNELISSVKKIFLKSPSRIQIFKSKAQNVPLPPNPVLTRWGTWLEASFYYAKHFELIKSIVQNLDPDDAASIYDAQQILKDKKLQNDLIFIASNFKIITESITKLETQNLPLHQSVQIVADVRVHFKNLPISGLFVSEKFEEVLRKNTGFTKLEDVAKLLSGIDTSLDISSYPEEHLSALKFAPITSCEVERSFSKYKSILSDRRQGFSIENLEMYLISNFN